MFEKHCNFCTKYQNDSSCECNKVVSDILGEIELFTDIESIGKMAHFKP